MKNALILFLALVCVQNCFGQRISQRKLRKHRALVTESKRKGTVILSLDTIFNKGIPYAILVKIKQMPYYDYHLFSLSKKELAFIQTRVGNNVDRTLYYSFQFLESEKVAEPEKYFGFHMEKEIVAYDLVRGDKINPLAEFNFLEKYPQKFSNPHYITYITEKPAVNENNIFETVARDHSKEIYLSEGKIEQDFKLVGRYKDLEGITRFYLPSSIMAAEAREAEPGSAEWLVTSLKDRKTHRLHPQPGKALSEIVHFLCRNNYL